MPKTIGIAGLVIAAALGLTFIQKDFNLTAEGTLEPTVRQQVFASIDGEVVAVHVQRNTKVTKGQLLVELRNPDIDMQLEELQGQYNSTMAERAKVAGQLFGDLEAAEKVALTGQLSELKTKLISLSKKLELQKKRRDQLMITAPIDGVVTTWDVEETLRSRPVMTGQVLMEVADLDQPYALELELPEKREGHLDHYVMANGNPQELQVTYILATDPTMDALDATLPVESISRRADSHEEHGAIIEMEAIPDQDPLLKLKPSPGASVIAKVRCGRASSGFVFFHEIWEWLCKFFF